MSLAKTVTSFSRLSRTCLRPSHRLSRQLSTTQRLNSSPLLMLSEDEQMMQSTTAKICQDLIEPLVPQMDRDMQMDPSIVETLFENGLMGVEVPTKYGGVGSSFFTACLIIEELAKTDPSVSVMCDVQNTLVNTLLLKYGTEAQQAKYLPLTATNTVGSFALSEAGSGSDAFALEANAKKDGDYWVLNGEKLWITNSGEAGIWLVFANILPSDSKEPRHRGITCFIIEKDNPGLSLGKKEDKLGIRASSTCPVHLEDCRVHSSDVLGEPGKGYKYSIETLNEGRIAIAAQMLGLAQGCFDKTLAYIKERKQFGQSVYEFQSMQHQVAHIATQIDATRLMVYNSARMKDANQIVVKEAAMAKYFAGEVATLTTSKCVEWMGGVGFTKNYPIEKYYRDCKIGCIYEGTTNIQLNTIAKYL